MFRFGKTSQKGLGRLLIDTGYQNQRARLDEALSNRHRLLRRLALAKNGLRIPLTKGPMVIDVGEPKILKREIAQSLKGSIGRRRSTGDFGEQVLQSGGIHAKRLRKKWSALVDMSGTVFCLPCRLVR
jgi:hypothetical protein